MGEEGTGGLTFEGATAGYEADPSAKLLNETVIDVFTNLHLQSPDAPHYIFEVGSGTGGTTSFILPSFNPTTTRYVFSDLSQAFLGNARARFARAFPFVEFAIFNGDKHPSDQGFHNHEMTGCVSTNCIHATIHLASTLATIRILLQPGGYIVFNEVQNGGTIGEDLTFGLTDGWWYMTDTERRVTYPLMRCPEWLCLFAQCGCKNEWHTNDLGVFFSQQQILVTRSADSAPLSGQSIPCKAHCDPSASYLITGAVGGLGLISALVMLEQGALNLHFISRRDRVPVEAMDLFSKIASSAATIKRQRCNASSAGEVARCMVDEKDAPKTLGYINGAGVLSDGTILKQNRHKYNEVYGPKVYGAWHCHRFSSHKLEELHLVLMYSSGAGFFGSPGQSNHSSANTQMETQAAFRLALGLSGGSIGWGAVAQVGYAARHDLAKGEGATPYDQAFAVMEAIHCMPMYIVGIGPGAWASGMGRIPMKAAIYVGAAGRFRPMGPKVARFAVSSSRSQTQGKRRGGIDMMEDELALQEEIPAPSPDDPAAIEYKAVFAMMEAVHAGWGAGGGAQKELSQDLGLGAQEVC